MRPVEQMASARSILGSSLDENREGVVKVEEEALHVGGSGRMLADGAHSTGRSCSNTDEVLKGLDGGPVEFGQRESIPGRCLTEMVGCDLACLADSWIASSKVATHVWMALVDHASGTSSLRDGWGGCSASAKDGGW